MSNLIINKMTKKICITFFIKAEKAKTNGTAPIYARITTKQGRTTFATGKSVQPARWTASKQLKISRKEEELILKNELEQVRKSLNAVYEQLSKDGKPCEAENIKHQYLNPFTVTDHQLLELFKIHNEKFQEKVVLERRSPESFKKHKAVQAHLLSFIKDKFNGAKNYPLNQLDLDFMEAFAYYLRTKAGKKMEGISNNTTMKYCQFFVSMIYSGIKKGWMKDNPFKDFEYEFDDVVEDFLTEEQIHRIATKKFATERLDTIRDIFLFSVFTGYAPIDARRLTHENIKRNIDGQLWIYTKRSKTGVDSNVPILPPVQAIIDKYRNHPECLAENKLIPLRSSTNMNEYLKEIEVLCQIPFNMHHYVARHSFGTLMITKGVSMESVSKMMGHKRIAQTQHYAKIVENKVGKEMRLVSDNLNFSQMTTSLAMAVGT